MSPDAPLHAPDGPGREGEGAALPAGLAAPECSGAALPPGVLVARVGAGANCSSAGSAIDILFYTSVIAGAVAVALSAAFPPRAAGTPGAEGGGAAPDAPDGASGDDPRDELR